MRLLAVDAATENCSVALWCAGETRQRTSNAGKAHAEQLLGLVAEVLAEGQVSLNDLDGIVASIGPGAFTGVRVTVAVAQGLAFGAGLRVIAVSTLEALAMQAFANRAPEAPLAAIAVLDARMHEVYWGCFAAHATHGVIASSQPMVSAPAAVVLPDAPHLGIGRGFAAYPMLGALPGMVLLADAAEAMPQARDFARLGALRLALGQSLDAAELQPLYLRDKVAQTEAERAAR